MIEAGQDAGFLQVGLDIFGLGNPLWSWDFDGNGTIKVLVVSQEHLPEAALPKAPEKGVTPDLRGMEK
jgi:hypothetical protein